MSEVSKRIFNAMKKANLSYGELAAITHIPKSALQRYATGETAKCPLDRIEAIAEATHVTKAYLMGWEDEPAHILHPAILPITTQTVPLMGDIACGEPIYAQEDASVNITVNGNIKCDFALTCNGDSMIGARIYDGDIVFIKQQEFVDDGTIAAVLIDDEATLKRVYHLSEGRIELRAENPRYRPIIIGGPNETRSFKILGKAVAFQGPVL